MGIERVRTLFAEQHHRGMFPGGQLVVRRRGEVLIDEAVGIARGLRRGEGTPVPVTPETRFQVMSASKAVVALAVALLEDRGSIDVSQPVSAYFPEFAARGKEAITLLDVLTHRSGLLTPAIEAQMERWTDWEALVATLADLQPSYRRGTQAYCPCGYGWILAEVVRRVTGQRLDDFLARVLPPELVGLEMMVRAAEPTARTYWLGPAHFSVGGQDIAPRFEEINNAVSGVRVLVPGAAMFTTARVLALFYETLVRGGMLPSGHRLLSEQTLRRYTSPQVRGWDRSVRAYVVLGRGFACGWWLPHVYGWWNTGSCFGHAGGYAVVAYADTRTEVAVALVTNANRSLGDLLRRSAPLGSAIRRALS